MSSKIFINNSSCMSSPEKPLDVPKVEETQMIFEESIVKIQRDLLRLSPQDVYPYYTLITKPFAVVILATTLDDRYILNEEYRHPTKKFLLSCPGGSLMKMNLL